jgi:hypothetical protein
VSIGARCVPGKLFLPTMVLNGMSTPTRGVLPFSSAASETANTALTPTFRTPPTAASTNALPGTTVSSPVSVGSDSMSETTLSVIAISSCARTEQCKFRRIAAGTLPTRYRHAP